MARALTIGQLARAAGVASRTIRYYEQIGVLPAPNRSAGRYRQYDQSGVQRLRFVRQLGFSEMALLQTYRDNASVDKQKYQNNWNDD